METGATLPLLLVYLTVLAEGPEYQNAILGPTGKRTLRTEC
jgi:hypothetical protein